MKERVGIVDLLKTVGTYELWAEFGRRFNVKYGHVKLAFHSGKPTGIVDLDMKINIDEKIKTGAEVTPA